ncbi:MAG TPA: hypothetical protein VGG74_28705 [Kofleriaceae bacterium]
MRWLVIAIVVGGCGVSPALTPADPHPTPFVGSVFTQCIVYVTDSGKPGRALAQQEFQLAPTKVDACPQALYLTNASNDPAEPTTPGHVIFNLSSTSTTSCSYNGPTSDNYVSCNLAAAAASP